MTSMLLTLMVVTICMTNSVAADNDAKLREELDRIAQRRILFGHQSVGVNLLDGIVHLAKQAGVTLRIAEVANANAVEGSMLGHTFIAENSHPLKKIKSFEQAMGMHASGLDIAFLKFCYVDITEESDVQAIFSKYRSSIVELQKKNPGTTFIHITAPLTVVQGGLSARMKYILGYAPLYGTLENLRREEYNALLRKTYLGREPIFDLARVESTAPDGKSVTVQWHGNVIPVMVPEYSDDGGHLNTNGKIRAARELISVLASVPDRVRSPR